MHTYAPLSLKSSPAPQKKTNTCRVLYVDIDIHHGDGVEEAFYTTDRCELAGRRFYRRHCRFHDGTMLTGQAARGNQR